MDSLFSFLTHKQPGPIPGANINFTGYNILDNEGPTIELTEPLTKENVITALRDCAECRLLHRDVELVRKSFEIDESLSNPKFMEKISGVFVHDKVKGLVMVKGPGKVDKVVSIEV